MDDDELRERMNELHAFFTEWEEVQAAAAERHEELIQAIADSTKAIIVAIGDGFRAIADVLARSGR